MPRGSIRARLVLLVAVVVSLFYGCFGIYLFLGFRTYLIHSLQATLARRAHQIASTIVAEVPARGEGYVGSEIEARFAPELNERLIRIADESGRTVYVSSNGSELPLFSLGTWSPAEQESPTTAREVTGPDRKPLEMVVIDYRTPRGIYRVEVGASEEQITLELRGLIGMLALGYPLFLLLTSWGAYLLVGRSLGPVDEIVRSAETITGRNLSGRLSVPRTGDEIERLSLALNRMIQRLDEAFQQAGRFSGDASHELRTPLTIMRGEIEALLRDEGFSPAQKEQLGSVLQETERLTRIVQGLLLMSRLEGGESQLNKVPLDLGKLTLATAEQMEPLAQDEQITLDYRVDDHVMVEGEEMRLQQVMVNLLDNAIKYTPREGHIRVVVKKEEKLGILEIEDDGLGISAEAVPHIFERFYRSSQASTAALDGTGLGLAMVKTIVDAHGGNIIVESRVGKGTRIRLEFSLGT
jgi:heavy metal sensor kinase